MVPYSAAQLYSYEVFKRWFQDTDGNLSVQRRLAAGACAGMTATIVSGDFVAARDPVCLRGVKAWHRAFGVCIAFGSCSWWVEGEVAVCPTPRPGCPTLLPAPQLTYPLDTLRLRIAVDPKCRTLGGAVAVLLQEGKGAAFYRGLGASMLGIAPYMGLELASYDLLPKELPSFARGFVAALIATVSCYPLDTVRRHIQLQAAHHLSWGATAAGILRADGIPGKPVHFVS